MSDDPKKRMQVVMRLYRYRFGTMHTGKQRTFVYDIVGLYKVEVTIPLAFRVVAESTQKVHPRVRQACREAFKEHCLLKRIFPDVQAVLPDARGWRHKTKCDRL